MTAEERGDERDDARQDPRLEAPISAALARTALWDTLLGRYGHGAVQLAGEDNAFYERHLVFDNVVDPAFAQPASASKPMPARSAISWPGAG